MKPIHSEGFHRPFDGLKELMRRKKKGIQSDSPMPCAAAPPAVPEISDEAAFAEAMAGVTRIDCDSLEPERMPPPVCPASDDPDEGLAHLQRLIENGAGFVVCNTPEYMEGIGHRAPPGITQRLHRGDFAVQAHLDLHGLTVDAARELFDAFLQESIASARSTVLIIHGRGLSSAAEPVLKTKVAQWLSARRWNKWVVAFTSARMCDGGSGATYVLLRRRPLGKRHHIVKK